MTVTFGPYTAGEVPENLEYTFADADGEPVDLTGYTGTFTYTIANGTQVDRTLTMHNPSEGVVVYQWAAGDLADTGTLRGQLTVTNGSKVLSDRVAAYIRPPLGGAF